MIRRLWFLHLKGSSEYALVKAVSIEEACALVGWAPECVHARRGTWALLHRSGSVIRWGVLRERS